jgi:hypothetical protein
MIEINEPKENISWEATKIESTVTNELCLTKRIFVKRFVIFNLKCASTIQCTLFKKFGVWTIWFVLSRIRFCTEWSILTEIKKITDQSLLALYEFLVLGY